MDLSTIINAVCSFIGSVPILCPPEAAVYYFLFTRLNPKYPQQLFLNDNASLDASHVDFNKPTKMYITGLLGTYQSQDSQGTKDAYLVNQDCNMFLVDASEILTGIDLRSGAYIIAQPVGLVVAQFIDYLVTKGLKLADLELLGMSLGGQVIGLAAAAVKSGKVGKIMAYDPVGLVFNGYPSDQRLDATDAELVVVLHTNPQVWGYHSSCGHVDFWVNRDLFIQPGCGPVQSILRSVEDLADLLSCSHIYSFRVAIYALNHFNAYPALKCSSVKDYNNGLCNKNDLQYVGDSPPSNVTGNYYAKAGEEVYNYLEGLTHNWTFSNFAI